MKKAASKKAKAKVAPKTAQRSYNNVIAVGGQNDDWTLSSLSTDSDVWQNIFSLRARTRDLSRTNGYYTKYREEMWANVFGEKGIALRMKVKETEDRVVNTPDEKWALLLAQRRMEKVLAWAAAKSGQRLVKQLKAKRDAMRALEKGKATIQVGELDVYANQLIEARWREWQRAEFCDVRGRRDYNALRFLRLWSAARDGDFFIRTIQDPKANRFGFSLQLVNAEWCDYFFNTTLANGNEVRMGIEYQRTTWGIEKPVAFYFIRRQPNDWQFSIPGAFNFSSGALHDRVEADEIIHYARYDDADSTRPAPWGASTIPKARQLDQYELSEVTAARAAACKTGWLYSDMNPDGGIAGNPDPMNIKTDSIRVEAGGLYGLPWGVKIQESDPKHPTGNFDNFRKGMLRSWCAGMPGANYNIIANDAEGVSYSTGRIFSLDDRELWKLIQRFDIEVAERPIFEKWLNMSLVTGAIPLPAAKFTKFNKPFFQGRRWTWVDPIKDAKADLQQLLLGITSRSRLCDENGADFDDILFELAEEEMLIDELGLNAISLESLAGGAANADSKDEQNTDENGDLIETEKQKEIMDAYGVGVRAGAITPQEADEEAFRLSLGLPGKSDAVAKAWSEDEGVRRPITLLQSGAAPAVQQSDGESNGNGKHLETNRLAL